MNILVRRSGALGDCLCVTPILKRLRKENPDAFIGIQTAYPAVFQGGLTLDGINVEREWDRVIDLDMAHETRRNMQAIDAYCEAAFDDHGEAMDKSIVFTSGTTPSLGVTWSRTIAVHANSSWRNRTMPNEWWDEVCAALACHGYSVIALGTGIDHCPPGVRDTRDKLPLHQQAAAIGASRLFICGASGLFILAAATDTPVIVPLTINRPDTALPWRYGRQGGGFHPLVADVPCIGCSERAGPVTSLGCEIDTYECIGTISATQAVITAMGILEHDQAANSSHRG